MRRARPEWDDSQAEEFISRQLSRCRAPEFIDSVVRRVQAKGRKLEPGRLSELRRVTQEAFDAPTNGLMVRIVIAGEIEGWCGSETWAEYLDQVQLGNA
jgi:hypothetical protein